MMAPLVEEHDLAYITTQTDTLHIIADSLWRRLGTVPPTFHLQCVTLFHR